VVKPAAPGAVRVAALLGLAQMLTWGTSYYLLAILAQPIGADTGWPRTAVTGGLSVGLVASGLVAPRVGALIEVHGGRPVLAGAALVNAGGLALLAWSPSLAVYLTAWVVIGVGMGAGLYDAAYAALGRLFGSEARRAITLLTLWGGFASTVAWPLSATLVTWLGWRGTCLAYAGLHLAVALPLCLAALPREAPLPLPLRQPGRGRSGPPPDRRFWVFAVAAMAVAAMLSALSVHVVTILRAEGLSLAAAVGAAALFGPAQVGARVVEATLGARYHPVYTMFVSAALIAGGFAGLVAGVPAGLALVACGAGNGIWSIVRGTLPLALYGAEGYPRLIGRIALPALLTAAAAPLVVARIIEAAGPRTALVAILCVSAIPVAAALTLLTIVRGGRR
jgi:MFS family permease